MDTPDKITAGDLEVCVLTFNRAPLLHQALESLLAQTARGFAVSVYDNASPDGTAETVEELRPRFGGNFRYVRHPKNIGADANFHAPSREQAASTRCSCTTTTSPIRSMSNSPWPR